MVIPKSEPEEPLDVAMATADARNLKGPGFPVFKCVMLHCFSFRQFTDKVRKWRTTLVLTKRIPTLCCSLPKQCFVTVRTERQI